MFVHSNLLVLMGVLTLHGQVHTGKIVGGHEAVAHSRPYMVYLETDKGRGEKGYCGGFLLSEDFVMTAAHCQAKNYTAWLGLHNLHDKNNVQRIPVKHAFPHKDYSNKTYKNDVMILKLSYKASFINNVTSIEIANWNNGSLPTSCIVSGWGITNPRNGMLSSKLMETNITLVNDENCPADYFYCSLGDIRPGQGDSGGPLVCEGGKAYGVVSVLHLPDPHTQVFCYTKISEYKGWIISTLKEAIEKN